jgi:hypothetical protein
MRRIGDAKEAEALAFAETNHNAHARHAVGIVAIQGALEQNLFNTLF